MGVPKKTGKPGKNGTGKGKGGKIVKGGSKASKGGKIVKAGKDKGGKVVKAPVRTPTLSEKNASVNKIISADAMAWKPVEIPDNLGDYDGFFGLEELEGVDVRMVNGKAEFIAKDDEKESGILDKLFGKDKKRKSEKKANKGEEVKKISKVDGEEVKVGEVGEVEENVGGNVEEDSEESEFTGFDEEELIQGTFSNIALPSLDESEIDLPKWEPLGLSAYTMQGLQTNGFSEPTTIQKETIPVAMQGKDVVGKATTGSGKTLAYGVPILERHYKKLRESRAKKETVRGQNSENSENSGVSEISETPKKEILQISEISETTQSSHLDSVSSSERQWAEVTGIIFAPTRELAHQVVDHLKSITRTSPLSQNGIVPITGGLSIQRQERLLSYKPGVVVATPGRFLELMERSQDLCKRMASTDMVVLDEADRLLQDGHFEEFAKILELLEKFRDKRAFGRKWQTLVFSATFSREFFGKLDRNKPGKSQKSGVSTGLIGNDEILELLTKKLRFKDARPFLCDANPKEIVSGQVTEALVECGPTERDLYIYYFVLNYPGSTLVFANSVESVRRLVPLLENLGMPAFGIHSAMIQKQRLRALERFKASCAKNPSSVLVATDVAARGLDIPNIDHIAHYHLPRSADMYVHRSGRTARAGREGVSVMFCSPQEASGPLRKLRKMVAQGSKSTGNLAHSGVKMLPIDYDIVAQIRERVRMASLLADSSIASTATRKEDNWVKQAAEDLGLDSLSDVEAFEDDVIKKQRKRKETKTLSVEEQKSIRARLRESLAKPLRKNHRRSYLTSGLDNLAHQLATGKTSKTILGMTHVSALDELKGKKGMSKRVNGKEGVSKQTKGKKRN